MKSGVDFSKKEMDPESVLNHQAQNAENAEQRMAFDFYYRIGKDRSLGKVAEQTGRSIRTIEDWSKKYRWMARVDEREKIAAEHSLTVQNIMAEQDLKKKHVNVYDVAITNAVKEIAEGRVKIKTVGELISLIDARWKLAAASTPTAGAVPAMHFHGPTKVDLGLERMDRDEKIKFLRDMLQGIMRVQTRPRLGENAPPVPTQQAAPVVDVTPVKAPGVNPVEQAPDPEPGEFDDLAEPGEVSLDID